ncbi:DUF7709 family protein [Pseudoalteromonas ostreae]|uniref:DUF7709 family protein n=1 Tax=Pseudoalteromonas ostreae TaxID=2774154 RepID=UPI001B390845|nr:hypothetical protein [Pseudoalteromonas ostreae]
MFKDSPENTEQLGAINKKIVADGEKLPAVTLLDGSRVQTGTVATMLRNVELYNSGERGEVEAELETAVPTLIKVGLFDLFSLDEWISGANPGRSFVGRCAKKYLARKANKSSRQLTIQGAVALRTATK